MTRPTLDELFQRSLSAHLPPDQMERIRSTKILLAGVGGGSNIAELLVRKGFFHLTLADPDHFESHNIRQRGCLCSTIGKAKVDAMKTRLLEINPHISLTVDGRGVIEENVHTLVSNADIVIDMIDFYAHRERVLLHRAARKMGKMVLFAPSMINGALLYIFHPKGITCEEFYGYEEGLAPEALGERMQKRLISSFPQEAIRSMYMSAARGERSIPLDAVGVDQASVLAVSAVENMIFERWDRLNIVPKILHVDISDPRVMARVVDFSDEFQEALSRSQISPKR